MAGEIGYYEDRVAKLELIIGRLLKLMPHLEKPDWLINYVLNIYY